MIAGMAPGTDVKVTYWRDGASHDVTVTLGTLPTDKQLASADDQGHAGDRPRRRSKTSASRSLRPTTAPAW